MVDSVTLVRRKVENSSLAVETETLNSVVTLAAIEYGKGNMTVSRLHIDGVKRMVEARGGIDLVKLESPLTARMFPTKDDSGSGDGISPIRQWQLELGGSVSEREVLGDLDIDPALRNILIRLRAIFHQTHQPSLTTTELHDLTCFVMHRLLMLPAFSPPDARRSATSECLRHALALYMLTIHGPTYYSHADLAKNITLQLKSYLETPNLLNDMYAPLRIWILTVAIMANTGTPYRQWFMAQACVALEAVHGLHTWEDIHDCLKGVLWVHSHQTELFKRKWEDILKIMTG
ncbi:uncharacterized protein JN550_005761 [Neoarthrinium moseri]|uniref:uncharacterized protein n=1 Tax=Neoarthrinium moseri TaxID=1658444 RepID=UPI001FDC2A65|nr:uncharacterized protein JN550_005761 [Neoarthrinium moseri]KAI1869780.1 hypothetical protein JN550_005761 [Neoarthrinium moseri]